MSLSFCFVLLFFILLQPEENRAQQENCNITGQGKAKQEQNRRPDAVKLNAKQLNQTIKLNIHRMEAVSHPLTYPLRIPASAQRMK